MRRRCVELGGGRRRDTRGALQRQAVRGARCSVLDAGCQRVKREDGGLPAELKGKHALQSLLEALTAQTRSPSELILQEYC